MRLGKVVLKREYIVNLDNEEMVAHATDAICEDVYQAVKYNNVESYINISEDKTGSLKESDILEFLKNE